MKVACIIQARLGSTRLPAKVLLPLPTGRRVIEEVVYRARQIEGIDIVVVAVPDDEGDEIQGVIFRSYWLGGGDDGLPKVFVFHGPHHDVLSRYNKAAHAFDADVIMRITADCPLLDQNVCARVLKLFQAHPGAEYCSNVHPRTFPEGWDCEVFSREALVYAAWHKTTDYQREHVTPFIIEHVGARILNVANEQEDLSGIRWTLDTPDDYQVICTELEMEHACA